MSSEPIAHGPGAPRLSAPVALAGAVLIGVLTATQARINGELGARLDDGLLAAGISFGSGFVILLLLSLLLPAGRAGARRLVAGVRARRIPIWMMLGGLAGAFTVSSQGLVVATLGVALFTVGLVAGQTLNGLVLDRIGYGPTGVVAVTVPRLIGGACALGAVVLSLSGAHLESIPVWMLVLPFIAGAGLAWQQATNGRLRERVGSALTATTVSFFGGSIALGVVVAIDRATAAPLVAVPGEPWLYLGGPISVVYILMSVALVRHTGVLLLGIGSVAGMLAGSVLLDLLWPAPAGPGPFFSVAAAVVAMAGVVIVVVPRRRRRG